MPHLRGTLEACVAVAEQHGCRVSFEARQANFVEYAAGWLFEQPAQFDAVIANPPYKKVSASSPTRARRGGDPRPAREQPLHDLHRARRGPSGRSWPDLSHRSAIVGERALPRAFPPVVARSSLARLPACLRVARQGLRRCRGPSGERGSARGAGPAGGDGDVVHEHRRRRRARGAHRPGRRDPAPGRPPHVRPYPGGCTSDADRRADDGERNSGAVPRLPGPRGDVWPRRAARSGTQTEDHTEPLFPTRVRPRQAFSAKEERRRVVAAVCGRSPGDTVI